MLFIIVTITISCSHKNVQRVNEFVNIHDSLKLKGYELVWNDEFEINGKPDTNKWNYDIGNNCWGNNELQNYTEDLKNIRVVNGKLIIEAHKSDDSLYKYTSARIKTKGKGDWLYGRFEVKAKIPSVRGTWPAIWKLPTDNVYGKWPRSGEIDIMEHVGYESNIIPRTVHTEKFNHISGTQMGSEISIPTATSKFHVYGIEWNKNKIDFFIDNHKYYTFIKQNKSYRE